MNRLSIFAAAAAALAAAGAATPAAAAEVGGARVEALIGYESARLDDFGSRDDVDESGAVFGLGIGYDLRIGRGVAIGVDLEATESAVTWRQADALTDLRLDLGRDLYAGGRLTAAVSPSLNLYLKAGYTNLRARGDFRTPTFSEVIESDEDGVRAGAGVQVALGGNLYAAGEYRISSYDGDLTRHQGVAGLGVRF